MQHTLPVRYQAPVARVPPATPNPEKEGSIEIPVLLNETVTATATDGATPTAAAALAPTFVIVEDEVPFTDDNCLATHVVAGLTA